MYNVLYRPDMAEWTKAQFLYPRTADYGMVDIDVEHEHIG